MTEPRVIDSYRFARKVREGCKHMMACGCETPMWLRNPSPAEEARWFVPAVKDVAP